MAEQPAKVALGLSALKGPATLTLTSTIVSSMTGNKNFLTPTVPLVDLTDGAKAYADEETDITNEEAKLKARRTANEGKLKVLKTMLTTQGSYVDGIAQGSKAVIESAGMPVAATPQAKGKLPKITGLRLSPGGAKGQVQANWDAIGRKYGGSGYMVYWGLTPDSMTHKEYAHTASLLFSNLPSGQDAWVCVQVLGKENGDCCQALPQMVP